MSFHGCFMHGVKLPSWPGLPTEANSSRGTRYLLWESFASVWRLRGLRGAERVLERFRGVCVFKAEHRVGSRRGPCKRGWCLGPAVVCILITRKAIFCCFSFYPSVSLTLSIQNYWSVYWFGWIILWEVGELKQKRPDRLIKAMFCLRRAFLSVNGVQQKQKKNK